MQRDLIPLLLIGAAVALLLSQYQSTQEVITPMAPDQSVPSDMNISDQGRADLIRHEGIEYTPYKDGAGNWTAGIGHKILPTDTGIILAPVPQAVSEAQVVAWFAGDLLNAEMAVKRLVKVPLTQGQYDALVDFVFQFGAGRLGGSTLLKLLNAYQYEQAAQEFPKWVNVGQPPRVDAGLVARRADNVQTFLA